MSLAESEEQAAKRLRQATVILAAQPESMQLRYLQTPDENAADKNTTIIFPLPMDLIEPLLKSPMS